MKRLVLFVALLAAVATVGAPRAADAATTYSARITIANQTIGLTAETDATNAQVKSVTFRVFLAPGECAKMQVVAKSSPKVAVADCITQANLDKGEIHVGVIVRTTDRTLRERVVLGVKPLSGGPYTFERLTGRGDTNDWVSAVYVKN
jgi:hypothetical protein